MAYIESDLIMISALVHYIFCPRRCALIHIEGEWLENALTAEGRCLHQRAHHNAVETRPDCRRIFGMPLRSLELGITGQADCVMEMPEGLFIPLEYKRGKPKLKDMDTVQLCAQALCIEEMLHSKVEEGFIYYFRIKKRLRVVLDEALRKLTQNVIRETRTMLESGKTPPPVYTKRCESCSLKEQCMPEVLGKKKEVGRYMDRMIQSEITEGPGV